MVLTGFDRYSYSIGFDRHSYSAGNYHTTSYVRPNWLSACPSKMGSFTDKPAAGTHGLQTG